MNTTITYWANGVKYRHTFTGRVLYSTIETYLIIEKHIGRSQVRDSIVAIDNLLSWIMATKNLCGKTRPVDNPYEIWQNNSGWEWRILKRYQSPENEAKNKFARVFTAVKSPFTYGEFELGDSYLHDITSNAFKIA